MPAVLVIDDDRATRHLMSEAFKGTDVELLTAGTPEDGLAMVRQRQPDVVLLDIMLPEVSGLELFSQIHALDGKLPVIFITAQSSSDTAIEAMKLGAYDYLLKPVDLAKVRGLVQQAIETRRMMNIPVRISHTGQRETPGDLLVGRSPVMQEVYKGIGRVAPQDVTVLIRGESGTGKEMVARAIYQHSDRSRGPFLAVNCAAIPDALLESELFGHEKGSFTGADQRRIGKFEQCAGGTIFLDEIGDMSPVLQSKMLRILQEHEFERVGGNQTIQADVRVIAATHRNLEKMIDDGEFRADLYYRLTGFAIVVPPLRERGEDLDLLVQHYLSHYSRELNREVDGVSPAAIEILHRYHWPGNVRELQNVLKQALLNARDLVLMPHVLAPLLRFPSGNEPATSGETPQVNLQAFVQQRLKADSNNLYAETLELMEQYLIAEVLRVAEGNQSRAAKILGITRGSLRNKIRALGVSIGRLVTVEGDGDELEAESVGG